VRVAAKAQFVAGDDPRIVACERRVVKLQAVIAPSAFSECMAKRGTVADDASGRAGGEARLASHGQWF
jgi:hypothetical protein